ncbi:MAG: hypothetical protein MJ177_02380 [Clostridia bacterium]|nr:hypothetical protein [Clostridia bacterium]
MKEKLSKYVRAGAPETKKFDMDKPMIKQRPGAGPFIWGFSYLRMFNHLGHINKVNMEGIKPPYILICNHNAFFDFYIMEAAIAPYRGIFPAAVDDYIGRERGLRLLGTVPKRKFTADVLTIKQCHQALKMGQIFGIYAEAKYSLCGVTEVIPDTVGQLARFCKVPVVVFTCSGHHLHDPFWGDHRKRWVKHIEATMTLAFKPEELKYVTSEQINERIRELLNNDDFKWQNEKKVRVTYSKRAEGLHKVLYKCPNCGAEYKTESKDATVFCKECGKSWYLNKYGALEAVDGNTEFQYVTDWYAWEREEVKKEVQAGTYHFECDCHVNDLPNSKGFVRIGNGHFVHDMNGLHVKGVRDYDGEEFEMKIDAAQQYALHVEYAYRFGNHEDCIDLNTLTDTWYVFPENCEFSLTKISLATEEIYNEIWRRRNTERQKFKKNKK